MADSALREHVIYVLQGGGAHLGFEQAIDEMPANLRGSSSPPLPHTPWQLLEHLRICQWDILEFSRDPNHVSPEFPVGYWPESNAPPSEDAWAKSVDEFRSDLSQMIELVRDPQTDLFAKIPHGDGQTILREALLVADHNAYHLGQFVYLRKLLGAWQD